MSYTLAFKSGYSSVMFEVHITFRRGGGKLSSLIGGEKATITRETESKYNLMH